jgi:hypothetical protein
VILYAVWHDHFSKPNSIIIPSSSHHNSASSLVVKASRAIHNHFKSFLIITLLNVLSNRPAISHRSALLFSMLGSCGVLNHWATLGHFSLNSINIGQLLFYSWTGSHYLMCSISIACLMYIWTRRTCLIQMCWPQFFHLFVGCT